MSKLGVLLWRKIFESGDARRIAGFKQDNSDLVIQKDIPYLDDGDRGHLLDLYRLPETDESAPVMINIHGGGLFASYKEVNAHYNYAWARMGYRVVSISYRRIPETTLWHQIDDVMNALRYIAGHVQQLGLNPDRLYLTGASAGALLSLFALSIENSRQLQETFGIQPAGIHIRACGLISIMLDTQRKDLLRTISDQVTDSSDRGKPWEPYLLDPVLLVGDTSLPPVFQVTSEEDVIRSDSLKLEKALTDHGTEHEMLDFPRGNARKLGHVFSVSYPMYPESRAVLEKMDTFFRSCSGSGA